MITGDHDRLQEIAKNNLCAIHKMPLEVAWHSVKKTWVLRCGQDAHLEDVPHVPGGVYSEGMMVPGHYPDAVTRQLSLTEEHKAGEELPSFIEDNIKKRQRRQQAMTTKKLTPEKYALIPKTDLGTGELLLPEVLDGLIAYTSRYRLDPERGHVVLMYGKPYITIDGYYYHANQRRIPYSLSGRPLTEEERKGMGLLDGDLGWKSEITLIAKKQTFIGIGIVTKADMEEEAKGKPGVKRYPIVADKPQNMVVKRAEWQALRRAFPIGGD